MLRLLFCLAFFVVYKCNGALAADPSVIIVGAGPAGIAAAAKLLENSITNIKIIEAEDRVGGRIKSIVFADRDVDEGAQYCHGEEGNVVYQLVKDLDLLEHSKSLTDLTAKVYYSNGSTFDPALTKELEEIILNYDEVIKEDNITGLSLGEAFMHQYQTKIIDKYSNDEEKLKIVTEGIRFAENLILMHEGAFYWEEPAAGRHYTACEGDQMMSWKKRGYQIIFDVLTQSYPDPSKKLPIDDKITLNKKISTIVWNGDNGVTAIASDNTSYIADHIIFTPSVGVLREEQNTLFDPQLPESKQEAIEALGFDGILKVILHFPEKWWNDEDGVFYFLWSDEDLNKTMEEFPFGPTRDGVSWVSHIVGLVQVEANPNTLIVWVSSDIVPEIEQTSETIVLEGCMYVIRKFLGKDYEVSGADQIIRSQWCSNPNFRGTYSFEKTGYYEENGSYQAQLAEPLNNDAGSPVVLFAGEATSPKHYSTVHGAIETGQREADRIINLYKKKQF